MMMATRDTQTEIRSGGMVHEDGKNSTRLRLERKDLLGIFGAITTSLVLVVGVMMFIFQTKQDSIAQHAEMRQERAVDKAVAEERLKTHNKKESDVDERIKDLNELAQTTDDNVRRLLWKQDVPAKPAPARTRTRTP